ncbi:MAG TPA: zinc ribbon domain-containing protein, partial [Candidatus Thermoplasmatota archaeon]|nr:zinc ribbon domain-containing protein [Candidatus Thermoplasmatota archaeon]
MSFCPRCGAPTNAGQSFCGSCGERLAAGIVAPPPPPAAPSPAFAPAPAPPASGPAGRVREPFIVVLLAVVTLGLYSLYY